MQSVLRRTWGKEQENRCRERGACPVETNFGEMEYKGLSFCNRNIAWDLL
jgi:hypothetical protein